ncbi:MAG TPA: CDP-alcohol phosphatidyltransferase family protein [Candidatus Saccharimonadales bacterium]|nr:CDP-alcohol phosphatidyltransferase family protein [Candidatus Saccharimonadales bacterium]
MKYTLHTAKKADWEKPGKKNAWQRLAYRSHGIVTPANIASLVGGALAMYGLWLILDGRIVSGLVYLSLGRIADIADGMIAEYTRTKSPIGEMIDATIDKFVVASALIVLGALELVPWIIILLIALQNAVNVMISVIAKLRHKALHPSRLGKVSAAFSWVTIILYPLSDWLQRDAYSASAQFLKIISLVSFVIYMVLGSQATLGYAHVIYKKSGLNRLFR